MTQDTLSKENSPSIITSEPTLREQQCSLYLAVPPSSPPLLCTHAHNRQTPRASILPGLVTSLQVELPHSTLWPNIPASGMTYWCTLERKHKAKKQGDLKVRMTFSSEKNHQVASQEHRHLLRLLLLHELDKSKTDMSESVDDCFNEEDDHDEEIFSKELEVALRVSHSSLMSSDKMKPRSRDWAEKMFWEATKKLIPSCMNAIRKIRRLTPSERHTSNLISSILRLGLGASPMASVPHEVLVMQLSTTCPQVQHYNNDKCAA
uniref:Uncharacterized protein n=1 Tax=Timema douglasi TaxID=61478 RepID=A0A7R8ZDQ0_TIMDO|nr:unnamed protein product [Timema douglasi]